METYGLLLTHMVFEPPSVIRAWQHARAYSESFGLPLRVRLRLDPNAPELHSLCWEALQDPEHGTVLCLSERVLFSRYIESYNVVPLSIPQRSRMRALIAVASPSDLETYSLSPVDIAQEVRRARVALSPMPLTVLDGRGGRPRATWANLCAQLAEGYDILYLVCHGSSADGETCLWLEQSNGRTSRVPARALAAQIERLRHRPVLVVLAACQSAGGPNSARTALPLGAMLARTGIGAVLAMHGSVGAEALGEMMPVFFGRLRRDGQIDHALATARTVSSHASWWMPVLWTRMRSGMLWREACAAGD
jgi:hypothetical protein